MIPAMERPAMTTAMPDAPAFSASPKAIPEPSPGSLPRPLSGLARVPRFVGGGAIAWEDRPLPVPGPGELLVAVAANALCGSERGQFEHGAAVAPGHELSGTVLAAGPGAGIAPGTAGVAYLMDYCGACRWCRAGRTNQCQAKRGDLGFTRDGGYGSHALVSASAFVATPPGLDPVEATLLLDIMGTGGHALDRAALVHPDLRRVAVLGAGPIGLGVLAMARVRFGDEVPVMISDRVPYRLELAERIGGIPVQAGELARHPAPDLVVDTTGATAARAEGMAALAPCGALVCVGHGGGLNLEVSRDLIAPERAVLGAEYFPVADIARNLPLLRAHRERFAPIITHRLPVAELADAFRLFLGGNTGKVVVTHAGGSQP
jgi:threonine dehydrogenase-like Zn-dependent dehydrogenase